MASCSICGKNLWRARMGICEACAQTERERVYAEGQSRQAAQAEVAKIKRPSLILTTESASALSISERLGIVSGEIVLGLNIFKDLFSEVRDLVGGRSATLEKAISDAREGALDRLADKAAGLGADAVVGISFETSDIGFRGQMIMIAATGTAVRCSLIAPPSPPEEP